NALLPKLLDLLRHAVNAVLRRDADLEALDRLADGGLLVRNRQVDGSRVLGIDRSHRLQQDRGITDIAGDRAGLVQRRGEGNSAPARAAAISRLEADGTGERRRLADRAAGVGRGGAGA